MKWIYILPLFAMVLFACEEEESQSEKDERIIQDYIKENNIDATRDSNGLYYSITETGSGGYPDITSCVEIKYKGYLTDGSVFGEDLKEYYLNEVFVGWQLSILKLQAGGKGTFIIPSGLAFGSNSYVGIPSNSVVVFEIELLSIDVSRPEKEDEMIQAYIDSNNIAAVRDTSGLYYEIIEPGSGGSPDLDDYVQVKYSGYLLDSTIFDEGTLDYYSLKSLILGWQYGIPKFQKGGKGKLIIPSELGYGSLSVGGQEHAILVFDIELLDFK